MKDAFCCLDSCDGAGDRDDVMTDMTDELDERGGLVVEDVYVWGERSGRPFRGWWVLSAMRLAVVTLFMSIHCCWVGALG